MATAAVTAPERWKLCPLHDGYLVSDAGRVRRIGGGILKPQPTTRGYLKVHLGRQLQVSLHVVVAATFHGPRPPGHHVDHLDHDKHHNAARNLRYLAALTNSVRWAGRASDGSNVWETPDTPAPEDHQPLSPAEEAELWHALGAWQEPDEQARAEQVLRDAGLLAPYDATLAG